MNWEFLEKMKAKVLRNKNININNTRGIACNVNTKIK